MPEDHLLEETAQGLVKNFYSSQVRDYVYLSSGVLVFYDYLLTSSLEASVIWAGRLNATKVLFFVNRYATLLHFFFLILESFLKPATDTECSGLNILLQVLSIFIVISISSIFVLRTFALYQRSWLVVLLLGGLTVVQVGAWIWLTIGSNLTALPRMFQIGPNTCISSNSPPSAAPNLFDWVAATVLDAFIVILTVSRTIRLAVQARRAGLRNGLGYVLLRDGIFYYSIIFLPEFVGIALTAVSLRGGNENVTLQVVRTSFGTISDTLQTIMTSRLVLSLSNAATYQANSTFQSRSILSQPIFASNAFLGNIGAPLRPSGDGDPNEMPERQSSTKEAGYSDTIEMATSDGIESEEKLKDSGRETA